MTALDLQFRIDQGNAEIYVNSISAPLTTPVGLASNISFVSFAQGSGQIVYNDRPPIAELFSDPSPYQSYINQWITTLSNLTVNPLTLAQAQAVKCALINAISAVKRTAPVTVTVSGSPHQWDASDLAVTRMAALPGAYVDQINAVITALNANATASGTMNTEVGSFVGSLNSGLAAIVTQLNTDVDDYNTLASSYGSFRANLQNNLDTWVAGLNSAETGVTGWAGPGNMTVPNVSNPGMSHASWSNVSYPSVTFSSISAVAAPTIQLVPVGGTTLVSFTPTEFQTLLSSIAAQSANAQVKNAQKQAAVNALTIMQDVISYDATAGW